MDTEVARPQPKPVAALTYLLGLITGIIFLYLEPYNRDEFVCFHARQSIAFSITWFAVNVIVSLFIALLPGALAGTLGLLLDLVNLAFAVLWVFLMYKAYSGERYRIPKLADVVDSMGF